MKHPQILTVGIAILALPFTLSAADRNWTGLGNPGDWNDPLNWDTGTPTTDTGDNIFIHLTGNIFAEPINASALYLGTGSPGAPNTGFVFGQGVSNFGFVAIGEAHNGVNPTTNRFGRAFIADGSIVNSGNFFVGDWDGGTGQVVQGGGELNIAGQFRVGHWPQADVGAGDASSFTLNGGTLTVSGDPANPFDEGQAGNVFLGIDSTAILTINGGTFTSKGIALDNRGATAGKDRLEVNGGTVNIGANGIVSQNATNPATYEVRLGGGTIRATANWTSNLETTLVTGGSGIQYDTNGKVVTLSGNLVGAGGLTKVGSGTLKLSGSNSFAGGITVNTGTVQIGDGGTTGSAGTGPVVIGAGTTVSYNRADALTIGGAVSGAGQLNVTAGILRLANAAGVSTTVFPGATLGAAGTLGTVNATTGSSLEAGVAGAGDFTAGNLFLFGNTLSVSAGTANSKFIVTNAGGFSAVGSNVIRVAPVNLTPGTYPLIDYAGTIGGAGFGSFSLTGLPGRAVGGLVNNVANTSIDLSITAIDNPKWTGAVDGNWDGTTLNWKLVVGGGATNYQNLDAVVFDDSATGTTSVDLAGPFTPSSVLFNNTTKTYTLTGVGAINGSTGVTKQGTGRVIVANTNAYTGTTNVQAGTLQIGDGNSGTLGAGTTVAVAAGGTVELNLAAATTYATPTSGAGTVRTIGANNFTLAAGVLSGTPELNVAGDSSHVLNVNNQAAFDGVINITSGTLRAVGAQALGTAVGSTIITTGGTLDVNGLDLGAEQIFVSGEGVFGNGAIVNLGPGTVLNLHKVTLTGDATFGGSARWDIRTGGIPGEILDLAGHKLTKVGTNQVSLVEVNATAGDIDINGGIFSIEDQSQVLAGGTITLNSGGSLGLWTNKPGTLTRQIVANGGGIFELGSGQLATIDAPISLQASMSYNVSAGGSVVIHNGNITESGGANGLNKDGPGRLILRGTNVWTGGYSVNNGVLQIGNGDTSGNVGRGPGTVNATLVFARTDSTTILDSINSGGPAGTIFFAAGGQVTLGPAVEVKAGTIEFGVGGQNDTIGGTLNIGPGTALTIGAALRLGNSAGGGSLTQGIINQTGGTVDVLAPNTDGRNFVLGHWGNTNGVYNLSAGVLNSNDVSMAISWDGAGTFSQSGGTANLKGLRFGHNGGQTGVFNLTGGTLVLGSEGIWSQFAGLPNDINLGGGIVRAGVDTVITEPVELTGTNGNVTFDTNGHVIVASGVISGAGGFTKTGANKLEIVASNVIGGTVNVTAGIVQFDASQTLGSLSIADGAVVRLGGAPPPAPLLVDEEAIGGSGRAAGTQAVPEPGSAVLLLGGIATLLGLRRRSAR